MRLIQRDLALKLARKDGGFICAGPIREITSRSVYNTLYIFLSTRMVAVLTSIEYLDYCYTGIM